LYWLQAQGKSEKKLLEQKEKINIKNKNIFHRIWKGSYPAIFTGKDKD